MTNNHEAPVAPKSIAPSQETIERGAAFAAGIFANAGKGRHILTVATARGVVKAQFSKDHNSDVMIDEDTHREIFESVLVSLEMDGVFGATLRSFAGAGFTTAQTEVRGWVVTRFSIRPLTAEEVIESYCVDHETGKILSPEPNVAYREGWEIA